ncbi:hypothetical protein OROMI_012126 [Orobanche minor]
MAPQNTMLFEVIGKLSKKSCFTLRVVRMWRVPLRNKPEVARTVDMVLQDTNGMRIQATIDRFELIEKYNDSIVEHGVYLMKNFNVTPNTSGWRPTSHAFKLHFNETTIVSENVAVDYPAFPIDLYHFKTVEQVLQTPSPNEAPDLIDFIGALVHTEKVYLSESAGSNMLTFHLLDSGNQRIHVTLWGEYADQAKGVLYTRRKYTIIVLLQFCRISRKKDTSIGLATSFHVTKLLIDEHIPEMEDFRYRDVSVERLSFHLPGQQVVVYHESDEVGQVVERCTVKCSKFVAWFKANEKYPEARELTYAQLPSYFTWRQKTREWVPRYQHKCVGRLYFVRPGTGERFYLRLLLNHVRGPRCFEDIRTFDGVVYDTFREVCYARGLLDDDKEYVDGIVEASHWASEHSLRNLFVTLLASDCLDRPETLWQKCWEYLSADIENNYKRNLNNPVVDVQLTEEQIKNYALVEIEKILRQRGKSLRDYESMPYPDITYFAAPDNLLINEQRGVYNTIMTAVDGNNGGVFFLYGHGGTDKIFLWRTLSAAIRPRGEIVLNVASSAIAATLLPGGRTAHSRFVIPLNPEKDSSCNIKQGSHLAELIEKTRLIIWDEAPMMNKFCFEALDFTMRDLLKYTNPHAVNKLFGGKTVVFGGDYRQILPVIPGGTRQQIVHASLNSSYLWDNCKVLKLTKNMRLQNLLGDEETNAHKNFSEWILSIGDGVLGGLNDGEISIEIPEDMLIHNFTDPVKAIDVHMVNEYMIGMNQSELKTYYSSDCTCRSDDCDSELLRDIHTPEFLNSISASGVPSHILNLKVGVPVMLMRNIDHSSGLCNGTRLIITRLGEHIIEARVLNGISAGKEFLIPRLSLTPSDIRLPFTFQRRQFPLNVCYAMTINKSQGQTLSNVGGFLRRPVFTHGQLYVAVSRVTNRKGLKFVVCDDAGKPANMTTNVVYKEVFNNL